MKYTKKQISDLLEGVYEGSIDPHNLPVDLYLAIAKHLNSGLYQIEGKISASMLEKLISQSVFLFGGQNISANF